MMIGPAAPMTLLLLGLPAVHFAATPPRAPLDQPNVIMLFVDDLGYGDVGFNGALPAFVSVAPCCCEKLLLAASLQKVRERAQVTRQPKRRRSMRWHGAARC